VLLNSRVSLQGLSFLKGIAGIAKREAIESNIEMVFGVNHLSHFLLTNLLMEKLKASAPSRIINVSSLAYKCNIFLDFIGFIRFLEFYVKFQFLAYVKQMFWDDLMMEKTYSSKIAYGQSKLANVIFTRELAIRLKGTGVTAYSLHPGVVRTNIFHRRAESYGIWFTVLRYLFRPLVWLTFKNAKQGAQTTIYCAVDEELKNSSGNYYADCKQQILVPHALNDDDGLKLWKISEELVQKYLN
jgi:retinol dehydrogenase-12